MQTIEVKFPAQRYHATPWDAHVNEGRVEWPPCPWRLLRALIAVGYEKLDWNDGVPEVARSLVEKLSRVAPEFVLPKSTAAHTRHYMPYLEGKNEKKTKVFDTFLKLENDQGAMFVRYDVAINIRERELLAELALSLSYLGRAESWVDARLLDDDEDLFSTSDGLPVKIAEPGDQSRMRLLAPMDSADFNKWREKEVEKALGNAIAQYEAKEEKPTPAKLKSLKKKTELPYPTDLVDSLQQWTDDWQKSGWPHPPGSKWVDYQIPDGLFDRKPLIPIPVNRTRARPTAILLAIDGEGKRGTLRPKMQRALPLMELLHSEAIRYATRVLKLGRLPELTGTTAEGRPRRGSHTHAHWLPLSFEGGGKIDHVLVTATEGFSRGAVQAISHIRWAYAKGRNSLSVNMVGQGDVVSIHKQLAASGKISNEGLAILKPSSTFVSATPMVLRKYLAKHGKKTFAGQVREELAERGWPAPVSIEPMSNQEMVRLKLKGHLLRRSSNKNQPPHVSSWGCKLTFEKIVKAPITLGYASHFGLGLFKGEPDRTDDSAS